MLRWNEDEIVEAMQQAAHDAIGGIDLAEAKKALAHPRVDFPTRGRHG